MTTFTNITVQIFYMTIVCLFVFTGCTQQPEVQTQKMPVNFIVLLDLSDRLTVRGTILTDQAIILAIAEQFRSQVRMNLTIRSQDKFKIRIIPQKGSLLNVNHYENELSADMSSIDIAEKNERITSFIKGLPVVVSQLYQEACQGKKRTSDYFGCDIWKYFHEQLSLDLEKGYKNYVVVLTDGYFDFEDSKHAMSRGNRHTSSDFYFNLTGPGWMKEAIEKDLGLIPVDLAKPFCAIVCGLNPKSEKLTELEKISWFWQKWMRESNADTCILIPMSSSEKMRSFLQKQISGEAN